MVLRNFPEKGMVIEMANKSINIQTPCGQIIKQKSKNGKSNAVLQWAPNFGRKHTEQFSAAQRYVDQAVLRLSDPLIPMDSSMLIKSGTLGTVIGSGEVKYIAPYAAPQLKSEPTRSYNPNRGGDWFNRFKALHKDEVLKEAKQKAGAK